jgi:hypothetical protein
MRSIFPQVGYNTEGQSEFPNYQWNTEKDTPALLIETTRCYHRTNIAEKLRLKLAFNLNLFVGHGPSRGLMKVYRCNE